MMTASIAASDDDVIPLKLILGLILLCSQPVQFPGGADTYDLMEKRTGEFASLNSPVAGTPLDVELACRRVRVTVRIAPSLRTLLWAFAHLHPRFDSTASIARLRPKVRAKASATRPKCVRGQQLHKDNAVIRAKFARFIGIGSLIVEPLTFRCIIAETDLLPGI